jgi:pimeloyl-ACP methyl ester carboxylesterase
MFGRTTAALLALVLTATACSSASGTTASTAEENVATTNAADDGAVAESATADEPASTDSSAGGNRPTAASFVPAPIEWNEFDDEVDVGTLDVPVDYGDPSAGGADYAIAAPQLFDIELLDRFDIIGWDPRGTGETTPAIDCIDDYDHYFAEIDITPETDDERAAVVATSEEFADACEANNASFIGFVGTNNSARDMDAIREALGEDTISYFGFSYGSELGATWATMFPETVRAAVLDGAVDPNADSFQSSMDQIVGFESSIETFLDRCSADDECAFHNDGDARAAYLDLLASLDEQPIQVEPDRAPVNLVVALDAVAQAMYSEIYWPALERALADAAAGDGVGLLALRDAYYERNPDGTYGNELEAFPVISCVDSSERPTVAEADAEMPAFHEAAPLFVPAGSVGGYFCTFFPPSPDPRVEITGAGAGPIVVIGTTGDPATPLESTRKMAGALEDGRLVVVDAEEHTGYGVNRCIIDVVNRYLVDLEPPESDTECG